jgi:hypothetical protein
MNTVNNIHSLLRKEDIKTIYINESGLYSLIFASKMEKAILFTDWVTSDVLPSIRKQGYYKYDTLEKYINKDVVYVLHIKNLLYKFGYSSHLDDRLECHRRKIDYNKIIKIYECNNINECINMENKIKELIRILNINTTYNGYTEIFKHDDINNFIKLIDNCHKIDNKLDNLMIIECEKTKQLEITNILDIEREKTKQLNKSLEIEQEKTKQLEYELKLKKLDSKLQLYNKLKENIIELNHEKYINKEI